MSEIAHAHSPGSSEMSEPAPRKLREIFLEAAEIDDASARAAFLSQACGDDTDLRRRVDELLNADRAAGPAPVQPVPADSHPGEGVGSVIGHYKLLQQIGEGGCGIVYMAEQVEPVRRQVALKIIKLGMDTRSVIARFEAERQALALMDHPNIAKIFDAGVTGAPDSQLSTPNSQLLLGRPYFVMELVRGIKITDYCDQNNLSTRQRLNLFTQVCDAVQHAHQKGVIHRDLKPSNILVTQRDGVPVPKVIDFGIAKAITDQRLIDKTMFTAFEQFLGTPAYMSPEQAELSELGTDTRSDIYSLGVLLYELLTGSTPFDTQELLKSGLEAMRRTIREQEPPTPSTRLASLASRSATSDKSQIVNRKSEIDKDLDWIVMKCLEKDRSRRYATANGLATDIRRHLNNEPVVASPPSRLYRFGKLVRRNRGAFAAAAIILTLLILGVGISTWEAQKAKTEAAKSQQVAQFLEDMLQGVGPSVAQGRDTTMLHEILDRTAERVATDLKDQPLVAAELQQTIAIIYVTILDFAKGERFQRQALETRRKLLGNDHVDLASSLIQLAIDLRIQNKLAEAEALDREALALCRRLFPNGHQHLANVLGDTARVLEAEGKFDEAEGLVQEALTVLHKIPGEPTEKIADALCHLADIRHHQGRLAEAEKLLTEQLPTLRAPGYPADYLAWALGDLANLLREEGKLSQAEEACKEEITIQRQIYKQTNRGYLAGTLGLLSLILEHEGKFDEAEVAQQEALAILREIPGDQRLAIAKGVWQLANIRREQGRRADAQTLMLQQLSTLRDLGTRADLGFSLQQLAYLLMEDSKLSKAEDTFREALALQQGIYEQNHRYLRNTLLDLAECLSREGKMAEAETDFREAIEIHRSQPAGQPPDPELSDRIGSVLEIMGKFGEAEQWYRQVLLDESNSPRLRPHMYARTVTLLVGVLLHETKFDEIEASRSEWLQNVRVRLPTDDPELADLLAQIMYVPLVGGRFEEAEQLARECVAIREKKLPDDWRTYKARCMLGCCLLGEKRYTEAEPLLLSASEGLRQHKAEIPSGWLPSVREDLQRPVALYEAAGQSEQAAEWRKKVQEFDRALTNAPPSAKPSL